MAGIKGVDYVNEKGERILTGGKLAAFRNKERYGEDFYKVQGARGGSRKVPKGFALDRKNARKSGALGGAKSRRNRTKEV